MTTLTLIYAADKDGNFCDPKTGKCWNADRDFFRKTIEGKSIICGRKTFNKDKNGLKSADCCTVLTKDLSGFYKNMRPLGKVRLFAAENIMQALSRANREDHNVSQIYLVGGKQTIKALAPLASRVLLTSITPPDEGGFWLPDHINQERIFSDLAARMIWRYDIAGTGADWVRYDFRRILPIEF